MQAPRGRPPSSRHSSVVRTRHERPKQHACDSGPAHGLGSRACPATAEPRCGRRTRAPTGVGRYGPRSTRAEVLGRRAWVGIADGVLSFGEPSRRRARIREQEPAGAERKAARLRAAARIRIAARAVALRNAPGKTAFEVQHHIALTALETACLRLRARVGCADRADVLWIPSLRTARIRPEDLTASVGEAASPLLVWTWVRYTIAPWPPWLSPIGDTPKRQEECAGPILEAARLRTRAWVGQADGARPLRHSVRDEARRRRKQLAGPSSMQQA